MATPLTAMSKYTGVFMAILCALLMISFVIADPLMQYAGGMAADRSRAGEVVAAWNGGEINERQLEQAVRHRRVLAAFQQAVYEQGTRDAMKDEAADLPLRVRPLPLAQTREQNVEQDVVQKKVFAQRAEEAGMVVSDEMVADYLRAIGRDRVSNDQMRSIISRLQQGSGRTATINFIFDLLRDEMLANNYLTSHNYMFETVLPAERYEDWRLVNDRLAVEAAPLSAEAFIDQVEDPTEEELAEFFELYRNRTPSPEVLRQLGGIELPSSSPAFATPARVKIAYLVADFEAATERLKSEVTDEQVEQFYKDNLDRFIEADRALFGDESLFEDAEEDSGESPTDQNAAAAESADTQAGPSEDATVGEEADEAVEEEEEEEEAGDEASEDATEGAGLDEQSTQSNVTYQPLEEVADQIRRNLAMQRADRELQETLNRLKTDLDDVFVEYFNEVLDAEDAEAEPPAAPESLTNLQPLAEANGMKAGELGPITQLDLREEPLGSAFNTDPSAPRELPVWFLAFRQNDLDTLQPMVAYGLDGNRYLLLVTERLERVTPELDDVRDEVVAAWKRVKASELALEKAKSLAESAEEAGGTLSDFVASQADIAPIVGEVFETETFSHLSIGAITPTTREVPLRLSQPEPLLAAGPELLEAIFELGPEDVSAAWNHDHSIAYVMRVAQRERTDDELREAFLREGNRWLGAQTIMRSRVQRAQYAVVIDLLETAELEWNRTPDQLPTEM